MVSSTERVTASWRLVRTGEMSPSLNMAVDEALFLSYRAGRSGPLVRVYGWNPPGFTCGSSQKPEELLDVSRCYKEKIPIVRRMTGGSVIFHKEHFSYSVVCSPEDIFCGPGIRESYRVLGGFLIRGYKMLGLTASSAADTGQICSPGIASFCFAATENYDILINGRKIGGSAQRRAKGALVQHGSIPLRGGAERSTDFLGFPSKRCGKIPFVWMSCLGRVSPSPNWSGLW